MEVLGNKDCLLFCIIRVYYRKLRKTLRYMHTIGIDFGTTKTLVSRIKERTGEAKTIRLGQGTDHIPTAVYIDDAGGVYYGDDADMRMGDPTGVYLNDFKMQLGNSTPLYMGTGADGQLIKYGAYDLVVLFLRHILQRTQTTVFAGQSVTRAVITRPVEFSPSACEQLRQAAQEAGFESVELITEPEAAGLAFCCLNDEEVFERSALVVDWGGGTLDFALITRDGARVRTHGDLTGGKMHAGGVSFDLKIWKHVQPFLAQNGSRASDAVFLMPQICKQKEKLSAAESVTMHLRAAQGGYPPIELTRAEFNSLIAEDVEAAAAEVLELMARIPATYAPEKLLLVGGTCLIPYVREKLQEICKLPAVAWHLSREAVALGAALWDAPLSLQPPVPQQLLPAQAPAQPQARPAIQEVKAPLPQPPDSKEIAKTMVPSLVQRTFAKRPAKRKAVWVAAALLLGGVAVGVYMLMAEPAVRPEAVAAPENPQSAQEKAVQALAARQIKEQDYARSLGAAVDAGDVDTAVLLLQAGADAGGVDAEGNTLLHRAAQAGNAQMVRVLLQHPQTAVLTCNHAGLTASAVASAAGFADCAAQIRHQEQGFAAAQLQQLGMVESAYPFAMLYASAYGYADILAYLLAVGADAHVTDNMRYTPLHFAAANGHADCVAMLLNAGVNINAESFWGKTPLQCAQERRQTEVVEQLRLAGATLKDAGAEPESAAGLLSLVHQQELLPALDDNAPPITPLILTVMADKPEKLREMIDFWGGLDIVDATGQTAIQHATRLQRQQCLEILQNCTNL